MFQVSQENYKYAVLYRCVRGLCVYVCIPPSREYKKNGGETVYEDVTAKQRLVINSLCNIQYMDETLFVSWPLATTATSFKLQILDSFIMFRGE